MRTLNVRRLVLTVALAALCAAPGIAGDGQIPLWEPTVINAGGSYVLTRDISASGTGGPAIEIAIGSDDSVEIDLNGFRLRGDGSTNVVEASNAGTIRIHNGSIKPQAAVGVAVTDAGKVVVENVRFDFQANTNSDEAITLTRVASFRIHDNVINDTGTTTVGNAINIVGDPADESNGTISGNTCHDCVPAVSLIDASANIRDNAFEGTGSSCIDANMTTGNGGGLIIANNSLRECGINVADVSAGCKVVNNVMQGGIGIQLNRTNGCLILDNVARDGANGIRLLNSDENHLQGNVLTGNALAGIYLDAGSGDNTLSGNRATGNLASPGACAVPLVEVCPVPYGGGNAAPDLCNDGVGNLSACDNLMPGPPRS